MAKAGKKASKKRKAKKVRKSPSARTGKKAAKKRAAKKGAAKRTRVVKKAGKASKNTASKVAKKSPKKAAKKAAGKPTTKKSPKKSANKTTKTRAVTPQETTPAVQAAPVAKRARPTTPRAKPAAAVQPAATAERNTYFITTAIAYPNGIPHIGHAYEAIATDALARFQRLNGKDVFFLTGTDEHGLKMVQTAESEGMGVAELAARNALRFKDMDERLNVSFDRFIRTTEPDHHRSVQVVWNRMQQNGDIYIDAYSGWYSVRDEAYYAEEETVLGEDNVRRGPQGSPVEWVEEKSYFFKLSAYQDRLLALYESQPDFIGPDSRRNEVISFVKGGLKDLSISRTTFDWGVKVPNDPEHVMYVWVDALTNYITGVGFPDESAANWRYWPADVHIIGKDIIRFHAVYWPAFLMSAGIPVQKRVYAHGFLFNRGEKMSKSVGNVVDPFNLADQYGVDQMRYFFLREVPFGQDGNYNHEAIVARINADLANDLGNLAQRSLSMIAKQLGGVLPETGEFTDNDKEILAEADAMLGASRTAMATQQIHQWLNVVWSVVAEANRYFAGEAPWALAKTDPARQKTVLYVTAEVVRQVAILTQPVMPDASSKLLDSLGVAPDARDFAALSTRIKAGATLPPPVGVFPRYVEPKAD
ncbi:methionine--tRNA ligase [Bradyrhizobium sp. AUGA SZCCT0283]|uniref:methionine--tRNA ligase n=1 Tax=Bradyrhizobium sp. AUGA SZCCT0283 TaxID=2807671 RepID=UPI001BA52F61|nr:methionine--tRNA ligase [Bradyrhizobium sp. AUGA SZCCT0283]MBR1277859.1 methionine--tRNA ligase [Bradyrhizobium sp. AUGA SZCCT0283]